MNGGRVRAGGLHFDGWPIADRAMWQRLVAAGGRFGEDGAFAQLRPASLRRYQSAYGIWLGWLRSNGVDVEAAAEPLERITLERLERYMKDQCELAPRTRYDRLYALLRLLGAAYPDEDFSVLRRAVRRLRRNADRFDRVRPRPKFPDAQTVLAVARRLIGQSRANPVDSVCQAIATRDALMLMLLLRHPLRVGNFAALNLGTSYRIVSRGHFILVPPDYAKAGKEIRFWVDPEVQEAVSYYLSEARPKLLRTSGNHATFWVAQGGHPLSAHSVRMRICGLTQAHLGIRLTPHDFRDLGATAMARAGIVDATLRCGLLAHKDCTTTDTHYNQASAGEALDNYGTLIERLTRKGASS